MRSTHLFYRVQFHIEDPGGLCAKPFIQMPQNGVHLSTMQLVKGFKRGEPTFLAALIEIVENFIEAAPLPPYIEKVLDNNKDVMLEELPKRLPP